MELRGLTLLASALMLLHVPTQSKSSGLSPSRERVIHQRVDVTRDGCGTTKLCVETPDSCDPAGTSKCLFASMTSKNNQCVKFQVHGESTGYVALGLTENVSVGSTMVFVCGQNSSQNGTFFFRTYLKNNTDETLAQEQLNTSSTAGTVSGLVIKCEFTYHLTKKAERLHIRTNDGYSTFVVKLGTGTVNGDTISKFVPSLVTSPLNILSPTGNSTTSGGGHAALPAAAPLLLGLVTLLMFWSTPEA